MNLDEAYDKLDSLADELIEIGDYQEFLKNDKEKFNGLLNQIIECYSFIRNNTNSNDFYAIDSMAIVLGIGLENPSLKQVSEGILNSVRPKKVESAAHEDPYHVDPYDLEESIDELVNQIREENGYDPNTIGEYASTLQIYKERLLAQKEEFFPEVYSSLLDSIDIELTKIQRFSELLQSDLMQDFTI